MAIRKSSFDLSIESGNRVLRTSNPEFSAKQKVFLDRICNLDDEASDDSCIYIHDDDEKDADYEVASHKKLDGKRTSTETKSLDMFCWYCHKDRGLKVMCTTCPRIYHYQCAKVKPSGVDEKFRCYECIELDNVKKYDTGHFNRMLKYILSKIFESIRSKSKFQNLIRKEEYPKHLSYAIDLNEILKNVQAKKYSSGKAFVLDIAWIGHIYCAYFPMRKDAIEEIRYLQKFCKDEIFNIETCAECFVKSNSKNGDGWFTKVCAKPHLLIWAKLSGYPYWPAKVMGLYDDVLGVQFFGEHERAFVPAKDCFLYSREDPNPVQPKTFRQQKFLNCVAEATEYIKNISAKFGQFYYAEFKTPFNPSHMDKYVLDTISGYETNRGGINPSMRQIETGGKRAITTAPFSGDRTNFFTSTPVVKNGAAATREALFKNAKRLLIQKSQDLYYRSKYAKIIENPGRIVLERIDSIESRASPDETDMNDFIETEFPKSDEEVSTLVTTLATAAINTADKSHSALDSTLKMSPFPQFHPVVNTITTTHVPTSNLPTSTVTSSTSDKGDPQPSTSARAQCFGSKTFDPPTMTAFPQTQLRPPPIVTQSSHMFETHPTNQEKLLIEMADRLPGIIRAAKEKMESLQNDYDTIAKFANDINEYKATFDHAKSDRNRQCVNCGNTARLFCTWSTGYCDYSCREQDQAKHDGILAENEDHTGAKDTA